jgi:hypothetical protein
MISPKRLALAAALAAALASAGCRQTRTICCDGALDSSVQFVAVPGSLDVIRPILERDPAGNVVRIQVQVCNNSQDETAWNLEFKSQFFSSEGRDVTTDTAWHTVVIGRGELKSLESGCTRPGAVRATMVIRQRIDE